MNFDTKRIKYIKAFIHWVQDLYCVLGLPSIVVLSEVTLKPQLDRASARSSINKSIENQTNPSEDAASPGPLDN